MDPVNKERLADNAFRTLGLSGSAGQSAIEATARRMRIWPDPSRIPPTPWDLPSLGPVRRSKADIEKAVSLLNQPGTRMEHRLLWFAGDAPPAAGGGSGSVADRHAAAIRELVAGWTEGGADFIDDGTRWSAVVDRIAEFCRSDQSAQWLQSLEDSGRFDKRASADEIREAVRSLPGAVAAGLNRLAVTALEQGQVDKVGAIARAVRRARLLPGDPDPAHGLLERIEDLFNTHCAEMEKDLRDNLLIQRSAPHQSYPANYEHSSRAAEFYDLKVSPVMSALIGLMEDDADRLSRVRGRCGELLILLALGWEWSGRFVAAEDQLRAALDVAAGTVVELEARRELKRVAPMADAERGVPAPVPDYAGQIPVTTPVPPPVPFSIKPAPRKKGRPPATQKAAILLSVLLSVAVGILRSGMKMNGSSSNDPQLPSPYEMQQNAVRDVLKAAHHPDIFPDPSKLPAPLPAGSTTQSIGDDFREP